MMYLVHFCIAILKTGNEVFTTECNRHTKKINHVSVEFNINLWYAILECLLYEIFLTTNKRTGANTRLVSRKKKNQMGHENIKNYLIIHLKLSVRYMTIFGSSLAAPGELPYSVTLFDRENGSSGHWMLPKMHTFLPSNSCY